MPLELLVLFWRTKAVNCVDDERVVRVSVLWHFLIRTSRQKQEDQSAMTVILLTRIVMHT
jgi:hypothetical protein